MRGDSPAFVKDAHILVTMSDAGDLFPASDMERAPARKPGGHLTV